MLAGLTESVVLALDADRAGADAMIRAQKVARGRGLELRVAAMPEGEDPADMLQDGSVERFSELVEGAIDLPTLPGRTWRSGAASWAAWPGASGCSTRSGRC